MNKIGLSITIMVLCSTLLFMSHPIINQFNQLVTSTPSEMDSFITFASDRIENMDIYLMAADGSNLMRLTINDTSDMSSKWVSNTGMITFSAWREEHEQVILPYIIRMDRLQEKLFPPIETLIESGFTDVSQIVPSPDGSQFAFVSEAQRGNDEIYVMGVDDIRPRRITTNEVNDRSPAWSPDGNKIVFTSDGSGNDDIYIMDVDGTHLKQLTENEADDFAPSWSPDGELIAFVSNRDSNPEIYVMNVDGSMPVNLTENEADDFAPSWSPDSSQIVFDTNRDGNSEIYVMNVDGSMPVNLTQHPAEDVLPDWSPWLDETVEKQLNLFDGLSVTGL